MPRAIQLMTSPPIFDCYVRYFIARTKGDFCTHEKTDLVCANDEASGVLGGDFALEDWDYCELHANINIYACQEQIAECVQKTRAYSLGHGQQESDRATWR